MVKQNLLVILLVGAILLAVLYFVWLCIRDAFYLLLDVRMRREFDEMKAETRAIKARKEEDASRRLDNDCDHDWTSRAGAIPANACRKCGLEKNRPPGDCDHQWYPLTGLLPISACQKCGKEYNGVLLVEDVPAAQPAEAVNELDNEELAATEEAAHPEESESAK